MEYFFVLGVGLIAGTVGGIVGFGSSIMLMPVLVVAFGPRQAVPIMAVAAIMTNLSRIVVWWRDVDWRACAAYSITGAPAAVFGARTLLVLPPGIVEAALGAFFIAMVPLRRLIAAHDLRLGLWHLAGVLSLRLGEGRFSCDRSRRFACDLRHQVDHVSHTRPLPFDALMRGLITGSSLMAGTLLAKRVVVKLPAERFRVLMDGLLLVSGAAMLSAAATQ